MRSVVPLQGAPLVNSGSNAILEDRQFSKKELERDWAASGPRILIVFASGNAR